MGILLPVLVAITLSYGYTARERPQEAITWRRRDGYDIAITLAVLLLSSVAAITVASTASGPELPLWYLRNLVLMSGIVLVLTGLRSAVLGAASAVLMLVLTTAYGPYNRGARFVRVFQNESGDTWSWFMSLAALAAGVTSMLGGTWLRGVLSGQSVRR